VAYVKALQSQVAATSSIRPTERTEPKALPAARDPAELEEHDLRERHWLASRGQKIVIYGIVLNFLLRAVGQSHALPGLVLEALYFCTAAYSLLGVVRICSGLGKTQGQKILFMVLCFLPIINLIALLYLNLKATRMLRDAGWTVGLLGARP
jgi:hypothetical protein